MPNNDEKKYLDWDGLQYYHESLRDSISDEIDDAVATAIPKSVVTTAGDLIVGNGNASVTRLGKGTTGQALVSTASGLEWQTIEATDTTYTFAEGSTNGAFSVTPSTPGATTQSVPIHGLMGAAYKGVSTSIGSAATDATVPTAKAVYDAIANLPEPMVFKGTLGTGGTITTLPTASASNEGWTYKVITAGTYAEQAAKVGDVFVCAKLTSSTYGWVLIPAGDTDTDTVREIKVNGTSFLGTGISTGYLNLKAGTNVSLSTANSHDVTITATDTNYYHTPTYSAGLSIATGTGVSALFVPNANGSTQAGVVSTSAQTFSGEKTFTDNINLPNDNTFKGIVWKNSDGGSIALISTLYEGSDEPKVLYLPEPGGEEDTLAVVSQIPTTYLKTASVSGNTLTITKQDNTTVEYNPSFADTNQKVKVGNTTFGNNAEINFVAGSNISITGTATGTGAPMITFNATDTNYYPSRSYSEGLQISTGQGDNVCSLYVPYAAADQAGVVSTGAQTFAGNKTFTGTLQTSNGVETGGNIVPLNQNVNLGGNTSEFKDLHLAGKIYTAYGLDGSTQAELTLPSTSGTLALATDIPTMTAITNNEIDTLFGNA